MPRNLRLLAAFTLVSISACGGETLDVAAGDTAATAQGEEAAPPDSVPFQAGTGSGADSGAATTAGGDFQISAEMLSGMLATDQGRQLVVQAMADRTGLDLEVAACFVAEVDVDTLVALSDLARAGSDPTSLPAEAQADQLQALTTCGIPPEALQG